MKRLDRSRPYGSIYPATNARAFVQDDVVFDRDGNPSEPETTLLTPPSQLSSESATENGGVFVSPKAETPPPPPVAAVTNEPTKTILLPMLRTDWETMDFRKLQKAIVSAYSVQPKSRKDALKLLREKGLIKGA